MRAARWILASVYLLMSGVAFSQSAGEQAQREFARDLSDLQSLVKELSAQSSPTSHSPQQGAMEKGFEITAPLAPVKSAPKASAATIENAPKGQKFRVLDRFEDWYAVTGVSQAGGALTSGWIRADQGIVLSYSQSPPANVTDIAIERIVTRARALHEKWKDNPFVSVTGFNLGLSVTGPEVSVSFQFK